MAQSLFVATHGSAWVKDAADGEPLTEKQLEQDNLPETSCVVTIHRALKVLLVTWKSLGCRVALTAMC